MVSLSIAHATQVVGLIPTLLPSFSDMNWTVVGLTLATLLFAEIDE